MYFTIKQDYFDSESNKIQSNSIEKIEESRKILNEFSEIKKTNDVDINNWKYDYFYIDIKDSRRMKILSLHDADVKEKLTRLETLLFNEKIIKLNGDRPVCESGTTGSSGYSEYSGSIGYSGSVGVRFDDQNELSDIDKFKRDYFTI